MIGAHRWLMVSLLLPCLLPAARPAASQGQGSDFAYSIAAVDRKPLPLDVAALRRVARGAVTSGALSFVVDRWGWIDVSTVQLSSHPGGNGLDSLRAALRSFRFRPAMRNGQPVRALVVLGGAATDSLDGPYQAADFGANGVTELEVLPEVVNRGEMVALMRRLYPRTAEVPGSAGAVWAQFVVLPDGRVAPRTITILGADREELVAPTAQVVAALRFRPGIRQGRPVRVLLAMPITWPPR